MEYAKKLLLVDPSRAFRPSATEKKLNELDSIISDVLASELSDDEKAKRYIAALKQHRFYESPHPVPAKPDTDEDIINSIKPTLRRKAKKLLKRVKTHSRLTDEGEIVSDKEVIKDSDISDLITDALTKSSSVRPKGWVEFADTLKRARTPRELVRNDKLWKYLNPTTRKTIQKRKWTHF
jgi:uncharacterized protein YwgA